MPAGKSAQSNAMLYTVIAFVGLFIIATTCAVIFYVKHEEQKSRAMNMEDLINDLATRREQTSLAKLVGKPLKGKSYLGTLTQYLNQLVSAIVGEIPDNTTASLNFTIALQKINETMETLGEDVQPAYGPEGIDLLQTITHLKSELDSTRQNAGNIEILLNELQDEFDTVVDSFSQQERDLIAQNTHWQQEADRIQGEYDQIWELMETSTDEQVQTWMDKLKKAENRLKQKNMELLETSSRFSKTQESLDTALAKLEEIKPQPGLDVAAFHPDAGIIDIDLQTEIVYLDIGKDDRVYKGLTFSVYDKNAPIPEDGRGKAEIEVFQVGQTISFAKVVRSSRTNPIVADDIVANLIWDTKTSNNFIVVGDFDFDGDGRLDYGGAEKIKQLIERWGGKIVKTVSVNTDFVVIGQKPVPMSIPNSEQIDLDPTIEQKYDRSLKRVANYDKAIEDAGNLAVPVFNQKRFLNLIGYESVAAKTSPF